jgi:hypothetical protein
MRQKGRGCMGTPVYLSCDSVPRHPFARALEVLVVALV